MTTKPWQVAITACALLLCWSCSENSNHPGPTSSPNTPKAESEDDLDALVLGQLQEAGSDLTKPHAIEFFLYVPEKEDAQAIAEKLKQQGFEIVRVDRSAGGDNNFLCMAKKSIVPELATMQEIRLQMTKLAEAARGEYDGWGTPVAK